MPAHSAPSRRPSGFTIVEVLVIIAIIAVLLAVLLPALSGASRTAGMAKSQSNMRQIGLWMTSYSSEHRETVLPSQFNYQDPDNPGQPVGGYPVKVRSHTALSGSGWQYRGTWTDILWVYSGMGNASSLVHPSNGTDTTRYMFDSPDKEAYEANPNYDENPFRSAVPNSRHFLTGNGTLGTGPKPFGTGATEAAFPGLFAANNFFNIDHAVVTTPRWYTLGEIRMPDRSMYLVDSLAGEVIEPEPEPFDNKEVANGPRTIEVDFRYSGACLMLFLDGSVTPQTSWLDIRDLEGCQSANGMDGGRRIRIRELTSRAQSNLLPCP